jgi:hypothetical protein
MTDMNRSPGLDTDHELRQLAIKRLKAKREFRTHLVAYLAVNTFLVVIWYATGGGFFWPLFPIFGWGIGLVLHAWDVHSPEAGEDAIAAEMERLRRRP